MAKRSKTPEFGSLLRQVIDDRSLNVKAVASNADMHITTLYRTLDGAGPSKGKALSLIAAVNRAAGQTVIEVKNGMMLAGYAVDSTFDAAYLDGPTADEIVTQLIDTVATLPREVQQDILAIARALYERHKP